MSVLPPIPIPPCTGNGGYLAGQQASTDLFGLWIYDPTLPVEVALLPYGESGHNEPQGHFSKAQEKFRQKQKSLQPLVWGSPFQTKSSGHPHLCW